MLVDTGVVPAAEASVRVPAQEPAPPPGKGPEFGNSSPVGLVVVLLLLIATVVLIRSMSKRIRRLPESFDPADEIEGPAVEGPAVEGPAVESAAVEGPAVEGGGRAERS